MTDWIFDRGGRPRLILDEDCFRSERGEVVAWLDSSNVFNLSGVHVGWFEGGVFYDDANATIGFTNDATNPTPIRPVTSIEPILPILAIRPIRPVVSIAPIQPVRSLGWSQHDLASYIGR
jgi:hypothetical protein